MIPRSSIGSSHLSLRCNSTKRWTLQHRSHVTPNVSRALTYLVFILGTESRRLDRISSAPLQTTGKRKRHVSSHRGATTQLICSWVHLHSILPFRTTDMAYARRTGSSAIPCEYGTAVGSCPPVSHNIEERASQQQHWDCDGLFPRPWARMRHGAGPQLGSIS